MFTLVTSSTSESTATSRFETIWKDQTASATARWGPSGAVVAVRGEIDAANAETLAAHVKRCAARCEWLVLDLSDLEFIATAGFAVLLAIGERCAKTKTRWIVLPGLAVSRLLRVCDPENDLPLGESMAAALADMQNPRRTLQAVSRTG